MTVSPAALAKAGVTAKRGVIGNITVFSSIKPIIHR